MLKSKHGIALIASLLLTVVAIPRLSEPGIDQPDALFTMIWLAFALIVIAANWRAVLQLDRERRRQAEQARRKRWLDTQRASKPAQRQMNRLY
ncbi:hypothetical protein SAMN05444487_10887 [Marininema mesophilum]|uniref:Uncharacterized protein n=1 Tax=Marininema mesophilum TaxID=1048340 RepID=A0A1H2XX62_9BACL|nr:hypothetical protein [Marininema mesophilum]SDW97552.1 hypothetical protein SAMN05444487_10887 [Marininema mesophilum]